MDFQPAGFIWIALILLSISGISLAMELGLARSLLWACTRAFFQLCLLGVTLAWIYRLDNILFTGSLILIMTLVATHAVLSRVKSARYPGVEFHIFISLAAGAWT